MALTALLADFFVPTSSLGRSRRDWLRADDRSKSETYKSPNKWTRGSMPNAEPYEAEYDNSPDPRAAAGTPRRSSMRSLVGESSRGVTNLTPSIAITRRQIARPMSGADQPASACQLPLAKSATAVLDDVAGVYHLAALPGHLMH